MNSTDFIIIYPPIKKYIIMNQIKISIFELQLYEYVRVSVILYDQDQVPRDNRLYKLEGDEYNNWANDDNYIITYVKNKLKNESN